MIIFTADLRLLKLAIFIHYHLYFITIGNDFQYFWGIDKIKFLCYNKSKFIALQIVFCIVYEILFRIMI